MKRKKMRRKQRKRRKNLRRRRGRGKKYLCKMKRRSPAVRKGKERQRTNALVDWGKVGGGVG